MYELKTKINDSNVLDFLNKVENKRLKEDSLIVLDLLKKITGDEPKMWGTNIIGFGAYPTKNKSGKTSDWMKIAFSPRQKSLSIYIMNGYDQYDLLLKRLGKHKLGKACLYINKLSDIDILVLEELFTHSYDYVTKNYV